MRGLSGVAEDALTSALKRSSVPPDVALQISSDIAAGNLESANNLLLAWAKPDTSPASQIPKWFWVAAVGVVGLILFAKKR